ncbi:glycosyltransferase family 4 protein [bacterium]|nr:glycosyltransferase family 4 protein [bacterium]
MRRLLVLSFFPAFHPPRSGGEARLYHLYAALGGELDVTIVSPTYPDHPREVIRLAPRLREHRIPKTALHLRLHMALDAEAIGPECSGLVCALASAADDEYRRTVRELVADADAVVHEFPYMLGYDEGFGRDGRPRIYNSHNLEARMAADLFQGPRRQRYVDFVADLEARLVRGCDLVFATSDAERAAFHQRYGRPLDTIALAPNGVEPRAPEVADGPSRAAARRALGLPPDAPLAIFLGSAHPPNRDAARALCEELAPRAPELHLAIAGSVCATLGPTPANVTPLGVVSDEHKALLFRAADVALNPVTSGAGTNLKLLDYFAAGLAVVTTDFGARGLAVEDERHCIVAPRDDFPGAVRALAADPDRRSRLGRAAAELAAARYTWPAIAAAVAARLTALLDDSARRGRGRPRLLLLNDFPVAAAEHGGQERLRSLFARLAETFEVTLLCLSDDAMPGERRIRDGFTEVRVPRTEAHRAEQAIWNGRRPEVSTADILDARRCRDNALLVAQYRRLLRDADAVVLAHPYLAPLLEAAPPAVPVVYEALNVEVELKTALLAAHPDREALLAIVTEVEALACARAQHVVCVSEEDRATFARHVDPARLTVIANGVDSTTYAADPPALDAVRRYLDGRPLAVFLGSGHPPNVEAARCIAERLAPACPEVVFAIVGGAGDALRDQSCPANVLPVGFVSAAEKTALLRLADVAINPMRSGGGSSLKVAEFLAAGLPVLSTPIGLRGFALTPGVEAVTAELDDFAAALRGLLADAPRRQALAARAGAYARQHCDWAPLARRYGELLARLIAERPTRLLVCTFRFTDPPRGGAEAYLFRVLEQLAPRHRFIVDVASFAVAEIGVEAHFGARYEPGPVAAPPFVRRVHPFAVEAPPRAALLDACRELFALWQREDAALAAPFATRFDDVVLLGGWYPPERYPDRVQRWSGARAQMSCPPRCRTLVIDGRAPTPTPLAISRDDQRLYAATVHGEFRVTLDLPPAPAGILTLESDAVIRGRGDARALGVCVTGITADDGAGARPVSLTEDYATRLRRSDPGAWIDALIAATTARAAADDAPFLFTRGPQSAAYDRWLAEHVGDYDVVLAHGLPFSPAVAAGAAARAAGVPYVVLPHFHIDDRYYHWQSYYALLRGAARVIAFPDRSVPLFFDRIGADAAALPGGGIDPAELADLGPARRAFRAVHASPHPFVLVLGRKEANKGYHRVLDAVRRLRARGLECDVVLIGPDADGARVEGPGVHAYGSQPRAVALGALASCWCLATMSESESFGIVLVEAWACGKPVIANGDCPAFAELVADDVDGLLCHTDAELESALARLLADPALAARLGAAGRDKALARYPWSRIAAAVAAVLRGAAGRPDEAAAPSAAEETSHGLPA